MEASRAQLLQTLNSATSSVALSIAKCLTGEFGVFAPRTAVLVSRLVLVLLPTQQVTAVSHVLILPVRKHVTHTIVLLIVLSLRGGRTLLAVSHAVVVPRATAAV